LVGPSGPPVLLALTVSPGVALTVLLLYAVYHAVENYVIVPRVYGRRLRLSGLAVLLAVLAAGTVGGIPGAIAVLPVVVSYPIIERLWLADSLGRRVVREHEAAAKTED
jgi:predicted PurR-regulated permease PerM